MSALAETSFLVLLTLLTALLGVLGAHGADAQERAAEHYCTGDDDDDPADSPKIGRGDLDRDLRPEALTAPGLQLRADGHDAVRGRLRGDADGVVLAGGDGDELRRGDVDALRGVAVE